MALKRLKSLLVAVFSFSVLLFSNSGQAQEFRDTSHHDIQRQGEGATSHEAGQTEKENFDAAEVIIEHIKDGHEFHFATFGHTHVTIPLPVILYSPQRGLDVFMSSKFEHGHATYKGYRLEHGKVVPVDEAGKHDESVTVVDLSLTRNVVQMFLAMIVLIWIMTSIAKRYKNGEGTRTAPKGLQNAIEPVITFVRDDVARPNLGHKYEKYLPYLLTVFFFILINNIFGLLPGAANVTGNIAFTAVMGVISFIVIMFSSNKHYWGHIVWPPVPLPIKVILIPVELLGVFTKPFALIIRLFANMVAGHIIILSFISLIFIFGAMNAGIGWGFSPVSILFTVFIYLIEILVAFIQAFIFTNLTAVFIGQAFEGSHDDVDGHTDPVIP
ncbi:MAG TPA: F0F1 ATP synthase subunit A [Chitinophagaceae bacterium]|nr:F0F1 ATP synthase subunit A [Chitinophagaceae bacterium]